MALITTTDMIKPTNKYERPLPPTKIILHGLDNFNPPVQIHINLFLPPTSNSFPKVITNLKSSLAEALELYAPINGTLKCDEKGEFYIAMDPESILDTPFLVEVKDTPYNGDTEDVSPRGFKILEPSSSIFAVKVTQFSCGNIAIGFSINHQITDLVGLLDFIKLWAVINRGETVNFDHIPSEWTRNPDRFFSNLITEEEANLPPSPPPFVRLSQPQDRPPNLFAESFNTRWKLSKANVYKLKHDFSPRESTSWISTGDALASLLCGAITRSRRAAKIPRLNKSSSLESNAEIVGISANGRQRAPQGNMDNGQYFGNFNTLWSVDVSHTDLLSPNKEAGSRIALSIRESLNIHLSPKRIAQKIAFFNKAQQEGEHKNIFWNVNFILTNWCRFDLQGPAFNFGWGKPFYSTNGAFGYFPPGYCLMTQTEETGDITVLMAVEKDAVNVLKNDSFLKEYAELLEY